MAVAPASLFTLPTGDLFGGSFVAAQFLREGDIIERKGHCLLLVGGAIASPFWPGRVNLVGIDLDGDQDGETVDLIGFEITIGVMVQTFTEL